jgi:hypothetical protein
MCKNGRDSTDAKFVFSATLDEMYMRCSADPSLTMTCVGLTSAMNDWRLALMDVLRTADPTSVAVTRMGQLQYSHTPQ